MSNDGCKMQEGLALWQTLTDPLQVFAIVMAVAMALEALLQEQHKDLVRSVLAKLQRAPIVPPRAIAVIDQVFGARLFSLRSFGISAAISMFGAVLTLGAILLTSPSNAYVAQETLRIFGTYPGQVFLFCLVFVCFDIVSYFVTRALVLLASNSASIGRGILLFACDLLLSVTICLIGLGAASTAFVATVSDDFWTRKSNVSYVTPASFAGFDAMFLTDGVVGFSAIVGIQPSAYTSPEVLSTVESVGLVGLASRKPAEHKQSAQLDVMMGADIEQVVATLNAVPRMYKIDRWSCAGDLIESTSKQTLIDALYGKATPPPCPLPTFYWTRNLQPLLDVEPGRLDDIFIGMTALNAEKLMRLLRSKFNEYIDVGIPEEWANTLYRSTVWDRMPWFTHNFEGDFQPGYGSAFYYPAMVPNFDREAAQEPGLNSTDQAGRVNREASEAKEGGEEWNPVGYDFYYNSYKPIEAQANYDDLFFEMVGWDGQAPQFQNHFLLPVSPFLASALWMSIVFYVFVIVAVGGFMARQIMGFQALLLRTFRWKDAPINFVGFVLSGAFVALAVILSFLPT